MAKRSAAALTLLERAESVRDGKKESVAYAFGSSRSGKLTTRHILSDAALHNAMVLHAAFGGSTNLLLHVPAIAFHAGLQRPTVDDWTRINRMVPRLVDALPNGPIGHPTVRVFLAGGVPEVMLHLRSLNLLKLDALTVSGLSLGDNLEWWERSERRQRLRELLQQRDGVDPDTVIMSPPAAKQRGLTSTVTFPRGNICPEGSVIKSTAIDPSVVDADGVYRKVGTVKVFTTEKAAIAALKHQRAESVSAGPRAESVSAVPRAESVSAGLLGADILVLCCRGPMGSGMEETYQLTSALKFLSWGKNIAVLTDARFSGVSTGACIGHVTPEALAGGPIGKLRDGDIIEIIVDRNALEGSINLIGDVAGIHGKQWGDKELSHRQPRPDLQPDPALPDDTKLWALLQNAGGGVWGGCVYDVEAIGRQIKE